MENQLISSLRAQKNTSFHSGKNVKYSPGDEVMVPSKGKLSNQS